MATNREMLYRGDDLINDPFSTIKQQQGRLLIYNVCLALKKNKSLDDEYHEFEIMVPMFRREQEIRMQKIQKEKPAKRTKKK